MELPAPLPQHGACALACGTDRLQSDRQGYPWARGAPVLVECPPKQPAMAQEARLQEVLGDSLAEQSNPHCSLQLPVLR